LYEAFADRSTHLGNFVVAVGNAELSNKIASYTTDQKVFVVKTCYSSGGSYVSVARQHRREFSARDEPWRETNYRTVKQFEERGSVSYKRAKARKLSASLRTK
jgi:hypothetical protein